LENYLVPCKITLYDTFMVLFLAMNEKLFHIIIYIVRDVTGSALPAGSGGVSRIETKNPELHVRVIVL